MHPVPARSGVQHGSEEEGERSMKSHKWIAVGSNRERCTHCKAIRSVVTGQSGWLYCQLGGGETTRDPGCYQTLPGLNGAAHVDGD